MTGVGFPEALRWWNGHLWFCDMSARTLVQATASGKVESVITLDDEPSGLGFLPDGTPLVTAMWSQRIVELSTGRPRTYVNLADAPGERVNDLVVDASGRVYVGVISRRDATAVAAAADGVVMVDADPARTVTVVARGLATTNGLVITPDGAELIVAETSLGRLSRFPILRSGELGPMSTFATVAGTAPDGICLDEGGSVWIGSVFDGRFLRVDPGGNVSAQCVTAPAWAVSPMLGGDDRRTLFMGTARTSLETMRQPNGSQGSIVVLDDAPVRGAGWP